MTINPTTLRIGSLLMWKGRIVEVTPDTFKFVIENLSEHQPLEITEERLIEVEFKLSESDIFYMGNIGIDKYIGVSGYEGWNIFLRYKIGNKTSFAPIYSNLKQWHELQNLVLDLTGKELKNPTK